MSKFIDRNETTDVRTENINSFFEVTTVQTVYAAKLQYWYLQLQQIASLKVK